MVVLFDLLLLGCLLVLLDHLHYCKSPDHEEEDEGCAGAENVVQQALDRVVVVDSLFLHYVEAK